MVQKPEAAAGYKAWQILKENCNPQLPTLNWTPEMLKGWLEQSSYAVKKPSTVRKVPPFTPLTFVQKPYETLWVVVNDVFAENPPPQCLLVSRVRITILHMPDHPREDGARKCWDEVECGTYTRYVTPPEGQFFDLNLNPD